MQLVYAISVRKSNQKRCVSLFQLSFFFASNFAKQWKKIQADSHTFKRSKTLCSNLHFFSKNHHWLKNIAIHANQCQLMSITSPSMPVYAFDFSLNAMKAFDFFINAHVCLI
jgi:hypothetical protein